MSNYLDSPGPPQLLFQLCQRAGPHL